MKPPRKIKVGLYTFTVEEGQHVDEFLDEANTAGQCNHERLTIRVRGECADAYRADTVLHEVLHAVVFSSGAQIGEKAAERFAQLSTPLLAVLRDNPQLVKYLLEEGK